MKSSIIIIVMLISVQYLQAQGNAIDKFYKDYQQKYSLNVVSLSGKMLSLLIEDKSSKEKESLITIINKLTGLKMLSTNGPRDGNELFVAANSLLPKQYAIMLSMDETDRKVRCYTLENREGKITELVMVAWQWGRFLVISITGDIDLKEIYKLSKNFNFDGLSLKETGLH